MLTLHHLETSRSSRVIWLLEALGLDYELVTYPRQANKRAPAELVEVQGRGKAPVLVDGELVLGESSAILRYVAERYGQGRFAPAPGTAAHAKHDEWLDFAEGSLMPPFMMKLIGMMTGGLPAALDGFATGELKSGLGYIARGLGEGPYLMGEDLTIADMQLSYCMALLEAMGQLGDQPALQAYWKRLQDEPGYKRMIDVGGPLVMPRPS